MILFIYLFQVPLVSHFVLVFVSLLTDSFLRTVIASASLISHIRVLFFFFFHLRIMHSFLALTIPVQHRMCCITIA